MIESDVDELKYAQGDYCRKGFSGCMCNVGYPYERQCSRCRDSRPKDDTTDWCYQGGFCWTNAELQRGRKEQQEILDRILREHASSNLNLDP